MIKGIIYIINIILVLTILIRVDQINNDKAPLIFIFYYPLIFLTNFILGSLLKGKISNVFLNVSIILLALFIPFCIIVILL